MPTRDINEYLESGEVDDVKKGGTTAGESLQSLDEVQAITDDLNARVVELEDGHTVVLNAVCPAVSQEPTGLDTPLQITLGPAQGSVSDAVMLDALGAITFNVTDKYILNFRAHYGRSGGVGTSLLMFRFLKNGAQIGTSFVAKIADADILIPWDSSSFIFEATAGDVLTAEVVRDGAGNDSGGLFATVSNTDWASAPCAGVSVYKV